MKYFDVNEQIISDTGKLLYGITHYLYNRWLYYSTMNFGLGLKYNLK